MLLKRITEIKNSLLFRLTILYVATFTGLAAIGFAIFYHRIHSVAIERIDIELLDEARHFSYLITESGYEAVRTKIIEEDKTETMRDDFCRLMNRNGDILLSTDMSSWGEVNRLQTIALLKIKPDGHIIRSVEIPGRNYNARVLTAVIGPSFILQIGETLEETDEYLMIFRNLLFMLILALITASSVIGWLLAKRSLADMAEVTRTAEDITQGAYDRRVNLVGQYKEIERLGGAFNTMLDRIENLLKSMREINDNIAHDLRSPLARIRGIAEMTLVQDKSIDDFKDMAISTIEECDSLIDIINTMLDITEIEAGINKEKKEVFDLKALILDALELFRPIAEGKSIRLLSNLPLSLMFEADKKRMQRIVANILENAIKFTPENGYVQISAKHHNGMITIDIQDTGNGISKTDLPRIFERFYRCDQSRSKGGVGLGLSLVKAYTDSMKGTIQVKSVLDQGSLFTLCFLQQSSYTLESNI